MDLPKVIGHRGAAAWAPENTLAGFRHAMSVGARMVEFDTQITADMRCIVFHDDKLDRTTDGSGAVDDTPYNFNADPPSATSDKMRYVRLDAKE